MANAFQLLPANLMNKLAISEILKCNDLTCHFGLKLSPTEALELVQTRGEVLKDTGRIEFSGGIINKLIQAFCDSPYISQFNYASTLHELIETFYYFKNETLDEIGDDDLIAVMKNYFNHSCQGSLELLQNRELEALARNIRYGLRNYEESYDE